MKTKNIYRQTTVLLSLTFACISLVAFGQDGKDKPIHTEKRYVHKRGKDSTVTIISEDIDNGRSEKKTIIIQNGDTTSNITMSENKNGLGKIGTAMIIDGDSIITIDKIPDLPELPGITKYNINKFRVIIVNGDSIKVEPDGENIKITIDTALIKQKCATNKSFRDASNKSIVMSDKYIIINTNKFTHKDSTHSKMRNVVGKFGIEGFDLGFTQFIDKGNIGVTSANSLLDLTASKSVNVNFRVFDLKINLINHNLYLNAGLEFDLHDYGFSNNTTLLNNTNKFTAVNDSVNFSRDKLSTQYLEVPLMLCFNSNPHHQSTSVSLGVGGYAGIMLGAYTKQVSDVRGLQRYYSNYECNAIDYGLMAEIGFGEVQLFGKYNVSSLFQTANGGPNLQSITFGIKLFHPFKWS